MTHVTDDVFVNAKQANFIFTCCPKQMMCIALDPLVILNLYHGTNRWALPTNHIYLYNVLSFKWPLPRIHASPLGSPTKSKQPAKQERERSAMAKERQRARALGRCLRMQRCAVTSGAKCLWRLSSWDLEAKACERKTPKSCL